MWVEGRDALLTSQCARAGWATGQARFVTREVGVQAGGHGSGLAPAEGRSREGSADDANGHQSLGGVGRRSREWACSRRGAGRAREARMAPMAVGAARRWVTGEWCFRGRLHGGRPHARWRRHARGMGSEPTKTSAVRVNIHLTTSHEGRASEARTVGGARGRCTAAPGICAGRVDVPRLFASLWEIVRK